MWPSQRVVMEPGLSLYSFIHFGGLESDPKRTGLITLTSQTALPIFCYSGIELSYFISALFHKLQLINISGTIQSFALKLRIQIKIFTPPNQSKMQNPVCMTQYLYSLQYSILFSFTSPDVSCTTPKKKKQFNLKTKYLQERWSRQGQTASAQNQCK